MGLEILERKGFEEKPVSEVFGLQGQLRDLGLGFRGLEFKGLGFVLGREYPYIILV